MCATCLPCALRGQRKVSNPLEVELRMSVSHHVGAGNQPGPQKKQQVLLTTILSLQLPRTDVLTPLL